VSDPVYYYEEQFLNTRTGTLVEIALGVEYGYFERIKMYRNHDDLLSSGGLWFYKGELIDYDGIYELPKDVIWMLRRNGIVVPEDL
jgi:hypothetical protein